MSKRKFDFECIFYANSLISDLAAEKFFLENLIDPEKLRYIVLQLAQNNYDILSIPLISEAQIQGAIDRANKLTIDENIEGMIKEGLAEYDAISPSGEYQLHLTELGEESRENNKAAYQKIIDAINSIPNEKKDSQKDIDN
jgi:hypothetical protein